MSLKYAIALSGGIGSGKSTVASLLKLYGYQVICADSIAHKILDENTDAVIAVFGERILDTNVKINRKKLGEIVFNDTTLRKKLEDILHPKIKQEILRLAKQEEEKGIPYFVDIPLFFEKNNYPIAHSLLIATTQELQISRLQKRNGFSKEEALQRINAQMPLEQKRAKASYVIDNCESLESLQQKLEYYLQQHLPKF
ncbi:dephospho-CoA kinase [Helicobacter sp. MIT 11-5569]|uniref:dephospho-CoA kinase n=1 Tax=Helicobacter sp. MIT 11-5569 TaxID=1548151 RepID=UPI00051F87EF|nr:dephospho-CoA kinase [Helicobacter sp. MIT 11-5569]TLD81425.1 dephospho-CoA kinase [Helicobacter sp. MIT 11-5569]